MSKGSAPRPFSVSDQEYAERWDAIFGRKEPVPTENDLAQQALEISCPPCNQRCVQGRECPARKA